MTTSVMLAEIKVARQTLIALRDGALQAARMDAAVLLSHTIALLHQIIQDQEEV